jgi:hypothetical protein
MEIEAAAKPLGSRFAFEGEENAAHLGFLAQFVVRERTLALPRRGSLLDGDSAAHFL